MLWTSIYACSTKWYLPSCIANWVLFVSSVTQMLHTHTQFFPLFNHPDIFEHYETASPVFWVIPIFLLLSSSRSVRRYFDFKVSLISAVHILLYGSHTRNQELPQTYLLLKTSLILLLCFSRTCLKDYVQSTVMQRLRHMPNPDFTSYMRHSSEFIKNVIDIVLQT